MGKRGWPPVALCGLVGLVGVVGSWGVGWRDCRGHVLRGSAACMAAQLKVAFNVHAVDSLHTLWGEGWLASEAWAWAMGFEAGRCSKSGLEVEVVEGHSGALWYTAKCLQVVAMASLLGPEWEGVMGDEPEL